MENAMARMMYGDTILKICGQEDSGLSERSKAEAVNGASYEERCHEERVEYGDEAVYWF